MLSDVTGVRHKSGTKRCCFEYRAFSKILMAKGVSGTIGDIILYSDGNRLNGSAYS